MQKTRTTERKRNRGYEETHQSLIETAVRMLSEKGVEALSVSALARETGINRTTVYYHFDSREAPVSIRHIMASGALPPALRRVDWFLRDFRTGAVHAIDPALLDLPFPQLAMPKDTSTKSW